MSISLTRFENATSTCLKEHFEIVKEALQKDDILLPELLVHVFSFLDEKALVAAFLTNKKWCILSYTPSLWQALLHKPENQFLLTDDEQRNQFGQYLFSRQHYLVKNIASLSFQT